MRTFVTLAIMVLGFGYIGWAYTLMEAEGLLLEGIASAVLSMMGVAFVIKAVQRRFDKATAI